MVVVNLKFLLFSSSMLNNNNVFQCNFNYANLLIELNKCWFDWFPVSMCCFSTLTLIALYGLVGSCCLVAFFLCFFLNWFLIGAFLRPLGRGWKLFQKSVEKQRKNKKLVDATVLKGMGYAAFTRTQLLHYFLLLSPSWKLFSTLTCTFSCRMV